MRISFVLLMLLVWCQQASSQTIWSLKGILEGPYSQTVVLLDKEGKESSRVSRVGVERINSVSQRLAAVYGLPVPTLFISKQNSPNAYVTMTKDGPIMVFGVEMLNLIKNDEEYIAAVVGHEFGHLKADHVVEGQNRKEVIEFIGSLIGLAVDAYQGKQGVDTNGLGRKIGNIGAGLVNSKFSRDQEREADELGIQNMARAGFDPNATVKLWSLMSDQSVGTLGLWMDSHPSSTERINNLQQSAVKLNNVYLLSKRESGGLDNKSLIANAQAAQKKGDIKSAFDMYFQLAERGSDLGQAMVLSLILNDKVEVNSKLVKTGWFEKAIERGNRQAEFSLGYMYASGRGVEKDDAQAANWYGKAAGKGHPGAQANLGAMYLSGTGVEKNEKEAFALISKSANSNNGHGQYLLGTLYENGQGTAADKSEAVQWFKKSAIMEDAMGQYAFGNALLNGDGVEKDEKEAYIWFEKSAYKGNAAAQYRMGKGYLEGLGGLANQPALAKSWLTKSANREYAMAENELGDIYHTGRIVVRDEAKARMFYQVAARHGNLSAKKALEVNYSGTDRQ